MSAFALHGFAQHREQWTPFAPDALAPWVLGHGPDPAISARDLAAGFDAEVSRLVGLARALPAPRVLLAYSQGARLGLGMLAKAPELFERACLVSVHPGLRLDDERDARITWEENLAATLKAGGLPAFLEVWDALPVFRSSTAPPEARQTEREARSVHHPEGLALALRQLGLGRMPNLWNVLPSLPIPVDFVAGARDAKFVALAREAHALTPKSRLHLVPNSGHNPLLDAPRALGAIVAPLLETGAVPC